MIGELKLKIRTLVPYSLFVILKSFYGDLKRVKKLLSEFFFFYVLGIIYLITFNSDGRKKIKTISSVKSFTLVGLSGLKDTYNAVEEVSKKQVEGILVECGVASGGCSALMASASINCGDQRDLWCFDTFEGLPPPEKEDIEGLKQWNISYINNNKSSDFSNKSSGLLLPGYCRGTLEDVSKLLLDKFNLGNNRVKFIKGKVEDTLPNVIEDIKAISILRIDVDWYEPVKACFEHLFPLISKGGYVIVDDYSLPGCKKATDEYLSSVGFDAELKFDERGGVSFIKSF